MLHDCVPQRLSSRRQQASACSFCFLAGIPSVLQAASSRLRPARCGRVFRKARKAQGRESTSATEPDTAALGEPAAPSALCAIKAAAQLGRARRGASGSTLLTRHAIGQRIAGSRFAGQPQ